MRQSQEMPTETELREAYRRAGLWRIGMRFAQAAAVPLVRRALTMTALARRRREGLPAQPGLFKEAP